MRFTEDLGIFLILFIAIIIVILIILIIIERKISRKIIKDRNSRNVFYLKQLENAAREYPKNMLINLDKIARNFFAEAFGTRNTSDYSRLESFFKQQNKPIEAEFCNLINHA